MIRKRTYSMLIILLVSLIAISAVSASEDANDVISMEEYEKLSLEETQIEESTLSNTNEEIILEENSAEKTLSIENENNILTAEDNGYFGDLNNLINGNNNTEVSLNKDYTFSLDWDTIREGIVIDRDVTIDGNGHTIDGRGYARIFHVTGGNVALKNIVFINGWASTSSEGGAIWGECTATNCTFISNEAGNGGAMSGGTAIGCTFKNNKATSSFWDGTSSGNGGAGYYITANTCIFTNNEAANGGAMYGGIATRSIFKDNTAYDGGAMFGSIAIDDYFTGNIIREGLYNGSLYLCSISDCTIEPLTSRDWDTNEYANISIGVKDYTGSINSRNLHTVNLLGNETDAINGANINVRIYKDGTLLRSEKVISGSEWDLDLEIGNYTATASVDNVNAINSVNFNINITKGASEINAQDMTIYYQPQRYLIAEFRQADGDKKVITGYRVTANIDGENQTLTTDNIGCVYVELNAFDIGTHTVTFTLTGHDYYEDSSKTVTVTITGRPVDINCISEHEFTYNSSSDLDIRLRCFGDNLINQQLSIDLFEGVTFTTDDNGEAKVPASYFNALAAGNYTTTIRFPGSGYAAEGEKSLTIIVNKQIPSIYTDDVTSTFNSDDKIVANITNEQDNPISGVDLTIDLLDGETFTTDANGQIEIPINKFAAGEHEAIISFAGNENYTEQDYKIILTINKESTQLFAENLETTAEIAKDFIITLKDSKNRTVSNADIEVCIEDFEEKKTDENGQVIISTEGMNVNTYTAFIFFNGNENYTQSNTKAKIVINKINPVLSVEGSIVQLGEDSPVMIKLTENINKRPISATIIATVDYGEGIAKDIVELDENGEGQAILSINVPGEYNITAKFLGDDYYSSVINSTEKVVITKIKTILTGEDLTMSYKDDAWTVTLTDANSNSIADQTVGIGIKGKVYNIKTDENGVVSLPINLAPGTYTINATFDETDKYTSSFVNATITVDTGASVLSADNIVMNYKDGSAWTVTLTDANSNAISDINLVFGIKGVTYRVKTDAEGVAKLPINLSPGTYVINATFGGNKYYSEAFVNATVTVEKAVATLTASDLEMNYKDGSTYIVNIVDANGAAVVNAVVKFTIGTSTYNIKTDANGIAKLPINMYIGEYDVTATLNDANYESEAIFNTITVKDLEADIVASDVNMTYKDGTSYEVQLTDGEGNNISVANLFVKITIKGSTYNVKTDANGIAKLPINLYVGTYDISAEYNGKTINNTITVNKA